VSVSDWCEAVVGVRHMWCQSVVAFRQWLGLGSAGHHVWCQSVIGVRQWSTTLVSAIVFSHSSSRSYPCFDKALQKIMTLYYKALLITTQRQELHQSLNCADEGTA